MANIAIRGHATRGKEVIEILEMLGGKSYTGLAYKGEDPNRLYCINKENNFIDSPLVLREVQVFSLEEFLEKFPYKVGDKAFAFGNKCTIIDAVWDGGIDEIVYTIKLDTNKYITTKLSNQLQLYKEETMEPTIKMNPLEMSRVQYIISIPKGYEFSKVDDDNQIVVFTKIQPQYPKTYYQCYEILKIPISNFISKGAGYKAGLLSTFQKLLVCRDAYWKIAGEQMSLGKPWKPSLNSKERKFALSNVGGNISFEVYGEYNSILCFPTAEMRDAFYENFKDLIEQCKELL